MPRKAFVKDLSCEGGAAQRCAVTITVRSAENEDRFLAFFHMHVYNTDYRDGAREELSRWHREAFARLFCA